MRLSSELLCRATNGEVRGRMPQTVAGIATDSRRFAEGHAFLALVGERFDGHRFAAEIASQAALLIGERERAQRAGWQALATPQLFVADTKQALHAIAAAARGLVAGIVVVITGSVGKTTTKEMLAHLLRTLGFRVHANRGNENNLIGLPLALLAAPEDAEVIVLEAGTNAPGEIDALARIARPDLAAITAIAPAHLEGLGSLEGVAREKGALLAHLAPNGEAWLGTGVRKRLQEAGVAVPRHFELDQALRWELVGDRVLFRSEGEQASWRMPLPAEGWAEDAALAIALARRVAARMRRPTSLARCVQALAHWRAPAGRLQSHRTRSGLCVIDDSYNANPRSLAAALSLLRRMPAPRMAVLGEMAELGGHAERLHAAVDLAGIEHVALIGKAWRDHPDRNAERFASLEAAEEWLRQRAKEVKTVLVKGSRAAQMERAVAILLKEGGGAV